MSLVIKKFAEGGSPEVRLYKRGNDEVDLNAFVRQAEAGFNDWLDKADIKEKHKKEVRAAYQDMITRINDDPESFAARLGGGFTNTAGITNKTKGFDAYGIAAGYLGNTLRGMSVYTKPEVKSDKPKYKKDAGFITSAMQSRIWGDSPESFIRLDDDSYDEATGQRGLTNRVNQTVAGLGALKGRLRDYYDFDSDDDYNHAVSRIDSAIASLQNANPNDDWFTLGQLGITGMDRFFSTGRERRTTPLTQEEQTSLAGQNRVRDFESWMSSNRPFYTGKVDKISLNTRPGSATQEQKTELRNKLNSLSNDDLKNWIFDYIENPNYDFTHHPTLMRLYGGVPAYGLFTPSQIMSGVLSQAIYSGLGKKISGTMYYFPDTLEEHPDGSSTVYVYNLDTLSLEQVDTQDIDDYRKQYLNEYKQSNPSQSYQANSAYSSRYPEMYPSHKDGGILKAQKGFTLPKIDPPNIELLDPFADWNRQQNQEMYNSMVSPGWARLNYGTNPDNDRVRGAYELLPGWEGARHDRRTANIGTTPQTPTISNAYRMQRNYINSGNMVGDVRTAYQNWIQTNPSGTYQDFVNFYNNKVQAVRDLSQTKFDKGYNNTEFQPLYDDYNWLYSSSAATYDPSKGLLGAESENDLNKVLGSTMFNRNALAFNSDEDAQDLRSGTFIDNDPSNTQFWINNEGKLELRTVQPEQVQDPEDQVDPNLQRDPNDEVDPNRVNLDESQARLRGIGSNASLARQGFWGELGTDLLGAGRLAGSIWANNRIARTVRDSLRPKLHDTYELYSPVTGAFGEMQLRNRQGAETLSQSYRPFTSDASLASARMLEGQRQANDLQYQGFLADDREIRRTQAEALQRQEGNIARRSALANENRDAIINNNQAVAQLEASRIKQNWNSIDNYLQGVEGRMRQRLTENRDRRNQFLMQTGQFSAQQERRGRMNEVMNAFREYTARPGNETKTLTDFNNATRGDYEQAIAAINADYEMSQLANFGRVYGYGFKPPKDYIPYDRNRYDLTARKHGGPLRLNSNQLIDKIIRKNNEGNS